MARMLHRRGKPAEGPKVFLAVAAYDGLASGFGYALYHSGAALALAGIDSELAIYSGHAHVDDCRNRLVRDFLQGDCTDLVFLDADVGWVAADLVKLLGYDRDVVAGVYPKKQGDDAYPVKLLPGEIWSDADGLIEAEGVPTGFLRIRRGVLEALALSAVHYSAKTDADTLVPLIFERQVHDGVRWGGDYAFCRKWRAMGGRIFVDPTMRFEHSGEQVWAGSLGIHLRRRSGIGLTAGLAAVREGRETPEALVELRESWGNPFAIGPAALALLAITARNARGPILECGSGLSSLVMAVANPNQTVHALEHSPVFAEHLRAEAARYAIANVAIHCRPLANGWYDIDKTLAAERWGLVIIDGPPRQMGERVTALERLNLSGAVVVADDVHESGGPLIQALHKTHRIEFFKEAGDRRLAIGAPLS